MRAYKAKTDNTAYQERAFLNSDFNEGYADIQAVHYSSMSPQQFLHLYDADGDPFVTPIPGHRKGEVEYLSTPVTVKLPLEYMDTEGNNKVTVFGMLH